MMVLALPAPVREILTLADGPTWISPNDKEYVPAGMEMLKGEPNPEPVHPPKLLLVFAERMASRREQPAPVPFSSAVVVTLMALAARARWLAVPKAKMMERNIASKRTGDMSV